LFKIYNINSLLIKIFEALLYVFAPFSNKIEKGIIGRKNSFKKLNLCFKKGDRIIHIHCASHGEYLLAKKLIHNLKEKFKNHRFLLSFISPSGYENVKNSLFDCIIYLPLATNKNCIKFYNIIKPTATFFIKNEIWPNYIKHAKMNGSKVYSIGGNFRTNFLKKLLKINSAIKQFDSIYTLNEKSKKVIESIGNKNTIVCGDLRFDADIPKLSRIASDNIKKFLENKTCIVFGSTWKEDEDIILRYIKSSNRNIKYIIAPHEISNNPKRIKKFLGDESILYSDIKSNTSLQEFSCLIVDNIGMLSALYNYSSISYVGGGMGKKGLHNTLEPAYFSKPIIIGKNYQKFEEANEMIKNGNMISISNYNEFYNAIESIIDNENLLKKMSKKCTEYFDKKKGAVKIILNDLK
jgi:3-deoxy-D-manno-octulosonic-acid transferase